MLRTLYQDLSFRLVFEERIEHSWKAEKARDYNYVYEIKKDMVNYASVFWKLKALVARPEQLQEENMDFSPTFPLIYNKIFLCKRDYKNH